MRILGIIPARYASTRFPGKPLTMINGKTMIQRVYEQSLKADLLADVIVATDDQRIFDAVMKFGGKVMMTSSEHNSGTDRCCAPTRSDNSFKLIFRSAITLSRRKIIFPISCSYNVSSDNF